MRRHAGELVYQVRDEEGLIDVVDAYGIRSLHFGSSPKQSAMALDEPDRLELPYTRAMLASLLFQPMPRRVLMLGLGGGTLARCLLRHFPDCQIDVVELRPTVVAIARRYFDLPDSPRLHIHQADGVEWVTRPPKGECEHFDLVMVDLFDEQGMAAGVLDQTFFRALRQRLTANGVLAINLWSNPVAALRESMSLLKESFGEGSLRLQVMGRGNVIGLGVAAGMPAVDVAKLMPVAQRLEQRLGVAFTRLLPQISRSFSA
jgi:spermidine synthase